MSDLLAQVARSLPEPVLLIARSGRVIDLNGAALDLLNLPRDAVGQVTLAELSGMPAAEADDLLRRGLSSRTPMPLRLTLCPTGGRAVTRRADCWRVGDLDHAWMALRIRSGEGHYGRFLSLTATIGKLNREVRQRQIIERQLEAAMERALAASRAKDDLLANVSHDLRTPLNAIIGMSEFMQQEPHGSLHPKYQAYIDGIHRSGLTLLEFVERMLTLVANDNATRDSVGASLVDLADCLESVRSVIAPLAEQKGLSLMIPDSLRLPRLRADQALVKQLLMNLLSNAVDYTPAGGRVGVGARWSAQGHFELEISDDGIGMRKEDVDRLMQPFSRGGTAYVRETNGFGLGLSLVKQAAEVLGVQLAFDSGPGLGTSVSLRFPSDILERGGAG